MAGGTADAAIRKIRAKQAKAKGPMAAEQQDDGSDIVALARTVGLAGVEPAAKGTQVEILGNLRDLGVIAAEQPDDGSDIVALARAVGLAGVEAPGTLRDDVLGNLRGLGVIAAEQPDDGSDVLALAKHVGLAGFADRDHS